MGSTKEENVEDELKDLKWIIKEYSTTEEKFRTKGIFSILVPMGCLVTTGVLAMGLHSFIKRDSAKQQNFMRYRVLAQGITIMIAAVGILQLKL